jgi:hypothetical protein
MLMSNYYSRTDMRVSTSFGHSLYNAPYSIRMEIALSMISAPHVVSSMFHSASPIYCRVEENSGNTPGAGTNRFDFNKGSYTKLTLKDLLVEYCQELEAQQQKLEEAFMAQYDVTRQGLVLWDTWPFIFKISKVMAKVEITVEQNNSLDDVRSSDCISVLPGNWLASILGLYPTTNSKVKSQDLDDMHNSKTCPVDDHLEDSASNGINEGDKHPASSIDMSKQQASSLVSENKIDGHMFDDVQTTS